MACDLCFRAMYPRNDPEDDPSWYVAVYSITSSQKAEQDGESNRIERPTKRAGYSISEESHKALRSVSGEGAVKHPRLLLDPV